MSLSSSMFLTESLSLWLDGCYVLLQIRPWNHRHGSDSLNFFCIDLKFVNWIPLIIIKNFVLMMRFEITFDSVHLFSFLSYYIDLVLSYYLYVFVQFPNLVVIERADLVWVFFPGFYWGRNEMSGSHSSLRWHVGAINDTTNSFISKS